MNSPRQHAPLTERRYIVPLVLITSLFFLWALGVNLNDILIRHLKKAFELTDFQSSLIQSAFFGGYFLAALPAGWVMQKIGYKRGILVGLLTCATGAFLFIPAATARVYGFFLFALFVMACGQCFLEVAANPYVTILGPSESAARRLNLAQSFNSVGAFITPIIGATFILSGIEHTQGELSAMTPAQLSAYQASETAMVKVPYLVIASIFLFVALLILFSSLPETHEGDREDTGSDQKWAGILRHSNLVKGVVAQFFYVGAQVGVASFVLRFVQHVSPGTRERAAAFYLTMHLLGFMVGRFAGSAVMKHIAPPRLLAIFAGGAMVCTLLAVAAQGMPAIWAVALIGFFNSIMFPTIFALSLKNLGPYTKLGSSLLVMSIIGGAIMPAVMGLVSDRSSIQLAFVVPLFSYAYVFYFAARGYRPSLVAHAALAPGPKPVAAND